MTTNELHGPGRSRLGVAGHGLTALAATGIVRPYSPAKAFRLARTLLRWGTGPAGGYASLAVREPDRTAVIDELGQLTFGRLHRDSNAIARALAARGVREGDSVAVMCRNHRWFVESMVAVTRLGADVLYLNTAFSGPQTRELLDRERPVVVVFDEEFAGIVEGTGAVRMLAWTDSPEPPGPTLEAIVRDGDGSDLPPPHREGRNVILTSGTTGAPKGASRGSGSLSAGAALLSRLPLRFGWKTFLAAPMFHTWGWAHLNLAMMLGSTLVLTRRFDPEQFLATVDEHRCESAVVIPVMLHRVLELPDEVLDGYDLSCLRVVASSGSALPGDLATTWMDRFGDHLYNTYGSTECAWATIARPGEMRAHPGTSGAPPIGTTLVLADEDGAPVAPGAIGRIFVSNPAQFEGYTTGGGKEMLDGRMSTGDLGRFEAGLLFVEGRDDEMIVSGGENVYPQEIEDCLARHADVVEATAVPVTDPQFGQRLVAYVVLRAGARVGEDDLTEHVKHHLARYKAPRAVRFVGELPRNATGKVLKRELAAQEDNQEGGSDDGTDR